jgi:hypothetical protein
LVKAGFHFEPFAHDGHQHIDRDGDLDLLLHRVLAVAAKGFDAQVLLDSFEEQLHMPALIVDFGDSQGGQREVVGEKDEALAGLAST